MISMVTKYFWSIYGSSTIIWVTLITVQNGGTIQSAFCILITVLAELAYVMLHIMNRIFLFTKLGSTFRCHWPSFTIYVHCPTMSTGKQKNCIQTYIAWLQPLMKFLPPEEIMKSINWLTCLVLVIWVCRTVEKWWQSLQLIVVQRVIDN